MADGSDDDDWNPCEQLGADENHLQQDGHSMPDSSAGFVNSPVLAPDSESSARSPELSSAASPSPRHSEELPVTSAQRGPDVSAADVEGIPEALDAAGMVALQKAMAEADQMKMTGTSLFKEGKYEDSLNAYSLGASKLETAVPSQLLTLEAQKLLIALYCNGAQASLKCTDLEAACTTGACTMAEKALKLEPTNVKAMFRRGLAYANAEDWEMACDDFSQAFKLEPVNEAVHKELQKAQGKLGIEKTPLSSKKVVQRSLRTPEDAMAVAKESKERGTTLFQTQQFWLAYEAFKCGAEALESDVAPCSGTLGKEAVKLKVGLCNNAAMAALKCTDVKGASSDLAHLMAEKVLELEPENVKALFRRGIADVNSGCFQVARQDFEAVLRLDPLNKEALRELQKIDMPGGNASETGNMRIAADGPAAVPGAAVAAAPATAAAELEPGDACKLALQRIEVFREQILAAAQAQNSSVLWSQRLNKLQLQTADWARHQLADAEMAQDLNTVNGSLFAQMDPQQKEDFVMAYEFETELMRQYRVELGALLGVAETPAG